MSTFKGLLGGIGALPVNEYGNVDIRSKVPDGYAHVPGLRLTLGCKKIGIECAPAMTGFSKRGGFWKAEVDGVVVRKEDEAALRSYIEVRDAKSKKSEGSRLRQKQKRRDALLKTAADLGVQPDSRTFQAYLRGEIDEAEARRVGEITRRRHEDTNYDDLLRQGYSKEEARAMMESIKGLASTAFKGLMGGGSWSAEDFFGPQGDVPDPTPGDLFRNSAKGYEFEAGGRRWRVTRDNIGFQKRLVIEAEKRDDEGSRYAEWVDGVLTISPLAKRGEFRPVGRPLVKVRLDGLGRTLDPSAGITVTVEPQEIVNYYETNPAKRRTTYFMVRAKTAEGELVGAVDLWPSVDPKGGLEAGTLHVKEAYRRKGIATALYQQAQKATGLKVFPSKHRTQAGEAFWSGARKQGHLDGLGALTSNQALDRFRFVFRQKQDGHTLSVYDGKKLIGKVGALTRGCDLPGYQKHANVVAAEILPEYRGQKLYQEMLLRLNQYAKQTLGCKGISSEGFQRSSMADRAWLKLNPRTEKDTYRPDEPRFNKLFLDGLPKHGPVPMKSVAYAMKKLKRQVEKCNITKSLLREGMAVEREHQDVTKGGVERTARIAAAHLCERRDYYKRLKRYVE